MASRILFVWALASCALLGASCAQEREKGEKKQVERQTSSVLKDWKGGHSVSADLKGVQFSVALATLQRQTGVIFEGKANEAKISLTVRDAPFWKAVGDLSIAAKTSFDVSGFRGDPLGEDPKVKFIPSFPACQRYQLVGPFHIGLWYQGSKVEPLVLLRASSLITEGWVVSRGIRRVVLKNPQTKNTTFLKRAEDSRPNKSSWVIPPAEVAQPGNLGGEMECEVYYEPQEIRVPLKRTNPFEFTELGGGSVSIGNLKRGVKVELEFSIDWNNGLAPEDSKTLKGFVTQSKTELSIEKEEAIWDWLVAKSDQLRLLHVQKVDLRNGDGKSIPLLAGNLSESLEPRVRGAVTFEKEYAPRELVIRLCERKLAIAVFEFENVFPR